MGGATGALVVGVRGCVAKARNRGNAQRPFHHNALRRAAAQNIQWQAWSLLVN